MTRVVGLLLVLPACGVRDVAFGIEERPANATCAPPARPLAAAGVRLERVWPDLDFTQATTLARPPDDGTYWYVAEQHTGRIHRFASADGTDSDVVLDVGSRLGPSASEAGLLGMAFHPGFADNGALFVSYTAPGLTSTLSRFTSTDGGATFGDEQILLEVDQPFTNHNGGNVAFGPDGFLYWGLGDGGSAGDPGNRAQDIDELLGKILRIDVDSGSPYGIPADNPYADGPGRDEIYAVGLRNPYRFAFDPASGDLWVGDVGQNTWEEVDRVERGGNYGWRVMEGPDCFSPATNCDEAGLEPPIAWYPNAGGASVIFGAVYHGQAIPALRGAPIYNDFYSGDTWGLFPTAAGGFEAVPLLEDTGRNIGHWAAEPDGELLALDYQDGIWRLVADGEPPPDPIPALLSETGCVDPDRPRDPAPGLVPYGVAQPFWSDGADKRRWMALPDGTSATIGPDGDLDFPIGTVLVKEMERDGDRIETRLFARHEDGGWAGYTYAWRDDGRDADLVAASGLLLEDVDPTWHVPSRAGCLQCHTEAAGHTLGLEVRQLAGTYVYPGNRRADQLATLEHIGLVEGVPDDPAPLPAADDEDASVDARARAWLHVNCAGCHRPGGSADLDLRNDTALAETGMCAAPARGDLGIADARIVAPGEPGRSVLLARASRRDSAGMPPVGTAVIDPVGVALLEDWIESLPSCP